MLRAIHAFEPILMSLSDSKLYVLSKFVFIPVLSTGFVIGFYSRIKRTIKIKGKRHEKIT